jgi:hypothetical protein
MEIKSFKILFYFILFLAQMKLVQDFENLKFMCRMYLSSIILFYFTIQYLMGR